MGRLNLQCICVVEITKLECGDMDILALSPSVCYRFPQKLGKVAFIQVAETLIVA